MERIFPSRFILLIQCQEFATSFLYSFQYYWSLCKALGEIKPNSNSPWSFQERTVWISKAEAKFTFITLTQLFWPTELCILTKKEKLTRKEKWCLTLKLPHQAETIAWQKSRHFIRVLIAMERIDEEKVTTLPAFFPGVPSLCLPSRLAVPLCLGIQPVAFPHAINRAPASGTTLAHRSPHAGSCLARCTFLQAQCQLYVKVKPSNVAWINPSIFQRQFPSQKEITPWNA